MPRRISQKNVQSKGRKFSVSTFLSEAGLGRSILQFPAKSAIFVQGAQADTVFYLQKGRVKLTVVSKQHEALSRV